MAADDGLVSGQAEHAARESLARPVQDTLDDSPERGPEVAGWEWEIPDVDCKHVDLWFCMLVDSVGCVLVYLLISPLGSLEIRTLVYLYTQGFVDL